MGLFRYTLSFFVRLTNLHLVYSPEYRPLLRSPVQALEGNGESIPVPIANVLLLTLVLLLPVDQLPIIYTPTEAEAISEYSSLFRRPEGLFLSPTHADSMEQELLEAFEDRAYDLVVVSDGEQILGIGDQGSGAIGISSSKAVIYTLIGGIDPSRVIPIALDVGTDNPDLRNDPLYVGWDHERLRGKEYSDFIQKFVGLIKKHQPRCLLHFEDFVSGFLTP